MTARDPFQRACDTWAARRCPDATVVPGTARFELDFYDADAYGSFPAGLDMTLTFECAEGGITSHHIASTYGVEDAFATVLREITEIAAAQEATA